MRETGTKNGFADLEVRIFPRREQGYPVEITLEGEQEFPRGYLAAEAANWTSSGDPVADGQQLLDLLLEDDALRQAWSEVRGQAERRRIRLRIDAQAAELHVLPWELLHTGTTLLSATAKTPFSRYLPVSLPWGGAVEERPIRVLAVISNPSDLASAYELTPVETETERALLTAAFEEMSEDEIALDFLEPPVTLERLEAALREGYHILHYVGHGAYSRRRERAVLFLQNEDGATELVTDEALVHTLARQDVRPRLIFLNACQSAQRATGDAFRGLAPKLVTVGVPAVVAMQDFVAVETARKLSATFYCRLLEDGQVDVALNVARSTLLSAGRPDAAVPVLFMRLKSAQLWSAEADARGAVLGGQNPRIFWTGLLRMIQRGKCIPVIGPRVHGRWLPLPREIAGGWTRLHAYPFADRIVLPWVAQYLASSQGEDFPRYELLSTMVNHFYERLPEELQPSQPPESVSDLVDAVEWQRIAGDDPNDPHEVLADLNLPLYVTTNLDNFMTAALAARGRDAEREICPWHRDLDWLSSRFADDPNYVPTPDAPLVYHLFGHDEVPESLVLTSDHYLDFLVKVSAEMERIPTYIRGALANSTLLFIGYSLYDWEFRVILRGLVTTLNQRHRFKHVTVQLDSASGKVEDVGAVQHFLRQYFQDAEINVFWGSTHQFTAELRERWEATQR
jgi:hypothetical protein